MNITRASITEICKKKHAKEILDCPMPVRRVRMMEGPEEKGRERRQIMGGASVTPVERGWVREGVTLAFVAFSVSFYLP